jgi:DNA-binding response OmpR family regulator
MISHVLVVEDEKVWSDLIKEILEKKGHRVDVVDNADDAIRTIKTSPPQLVISDINLGGISGIQLCQWLRADPVTAKIPVMMLTVLKTEKDNVRGLEAGADDYLAKPFGHEELLARVNALLRRARHDNAFSSQLTAKDLVVDLDSHEVKVKGSPVELRPKEFLLLTTLMQKKGKVVPKESLMQSLWGGAEVITSSQTLAQHVKNLRAKLGSCSDCIETVETIGYKFRGE